MHNAYIVYSRRIVFESNLTALADLPAFLCNQTIDMRHNGEDFGLGERTFRGLEHKPDSHGGASVFGELIEEIRITSKQRSGAFFTSGDQCFGACAVGNPHGDI